MNIVEIPVNQLKEAPWNPNVMDEATEDRLKESLKRYGSVQNLVVRRLSDEVFEVIGGNHRLRALRDIEMESVPCVVVDVDAAHARLLAQALNRVQGQDVLGLKAELVRDILSELSEDDVLSILPETAQSLRDLQELSQTDLAAHLRAWDDAQKIKLNHLTFQLPDDQLEIVARAMELALAQLGRHPSNPGARGNALTMICKKYLEEISKGVEIDEQD